jgi:periplasmic protein TonB
MTHDSLRLTLALGVSVLVHAWLLAAHTGGVPARASAVEAWSAISARLAVTLSEDTESVAREPLAVPRVLPVQDERTAGPVPDLRTPPARTAGGTAVEASGLARKHEKSSPTPASPKLPAAVDTTWYAAHDIDVYPRPGTPLRIAPPEGAGETVVRLTLWLRIDEQGEVVEVNAGEPGIPAGWVDAARASLAAIRFAPARKDERAVRSRLLLSVSFSPAGTRD